MRTLEEFKIFTTLLNRVRRLKREYKKDAPSIIIQNELRLIKDACDNLEKLLQNKN